MLVARCALSGMKNWKRAMIAFFSQWRGAHIFFENGVKRVLQFCLA
jgi:hypothetical protein